MTFPFAVAYLTPDQNKVTSSSTEAQKHKSIIVMYCNVYVSSVIKDEQCHVKKYIVFAIYYYYTKYLEPVMHSWQ